jgi:hypothetical protein
LSGNDPQICQKLNDNFIKGRLEISTYIKN